MLSFVLLINFVKGLLNYLPFEGSQLGNDEECSSNTGSK